MFFYYFFIAAPFFTETIDVHIPDGTTLSSTAHILKQAGAINSEELFKLFVVGSGGARKIKAGVYRFTPNDNVFFVVFNVLRGSYNIPVQKIAIVEGSSVKKISALFDVSEFPYFNPDEFVQKATPQEGYLFPDTYFVPDSATADDVFAMLSSNFLVQKNKIDIATSSTSPRLKDIITMASLIEGEAQKDVDRKIISGILWKRIRIGMPLQVDATFAYINGKTSSELTHEDLANSSPYNTYTHKGLPPTPINNPGLEAISAAMFPEQTDYLYYLSDKNGIMHYAKTFEEHKINKINYL